MSECKKLYYQEYHRQNYQKKPNFCETCKADLTGSRKKRCDGCKVESICCDCKKSFFYKVRYKRCTTCQYHWEKENKPEEFAVTRSKSHKKYNEKLRINKGLPVDHVFPKGPRGMGYLNKKGYILMVYKCPKTNKTKRKYQHVLVMMGELRRELYDHERVHHKNGVRDDNRIENLELWSIGQPPGQRVSDKLKYYIEFIEAQGYKVVKE